MLNVLLLVSTRSSLFFNFCLLFSTFALLFVFFATTTTTLLIIKHDSSSSIKFVNALERTRIVTGSEYDFYFRCAFLGTKVGANTDLLYVGTFSNPGQMITFNITSMTTVGMYAAVADQGENQFAAAIGDANGTGYFGTYTTPGQIVTFDLIARTRTGVVAAGSDEGPFVNVVRLDANRLAFASQSAPGKIVVFTTSPSLQRSNAVSGSSNGAEDSFLGMVYDGSTFVWVSTRLQPSGVVKFDMVNMARISAVYFSPGENQAQGALLVKDRTSGVNYGYFGTSGTSTTPSVLIQLNLDTMTREGLASGLSGEYRFYSMVASPDQSTIYVGCATANASVIKFSTSPTFSRVEAVAGRVGDSSPFAVVGPVNGNYVYWVTNTDPGTVLEWKLSNLTTTTTKPTTSTTKTSTTTTSTTTTTTPATTTSTARPSSTTTTTVTTPTITTTTRPATSVITSTTENTTSSPSTSSQLETTSNSTSVQESSTSTTLESTTNLTQEFSTSTTLPQTSTSSSTSSTSSTTSTSPTTPSTIISTSTSTATSSAMLPTNTTTTTTPVPTDPLANFTSPGLSADTQRRLQTASLIAGAAAGVLASPMAMLATQRALGIFDLAGCPPGNEERQNWITSPLSFPMTLFPGVQIGSPIGGHHRMAVVGFVFVGLPAVFLLTFFGWYVITRKKILRSLPPSVDAMLKDENSLWLTRQLKYWWFVAILLCPFPYSVGLFLGLTVGQMATSTGVLSALKNEGDGIFVDTILLTVVPWIVISYFAYVYWKNVRRAVFGIRNDIVHVIDAAAAAAEKDKTIKKGDENVDDDDDDDASMNYLKQSVREIGNKNQVGLTYSKFYVVPDPKMAKWLFVLKTKIAAFLSTKIGRFWVAGHTMWLENDSELYIPPTPVNSETEESIIITNTRKKNKKKDGENGNGESNGAPLSIDQIEGRSTNSSSGSGVHSHSDENNTNDEDDHHNLETQSHTGSEISSSSSTAVSRNSKASSTQGHISRSVFYDPVSRNAKIHEKVAPDNLLIRYKSIIMKNGGPPLASELFASGPLVMMKKKMNERDDDNNSNNNNNMSIEKERSSARKLADKLFPHCFVTKRRIFLAPFSLPIIGCLSVVCMMAQGIAKTDMAKSCSQALVVIVVSNVLVMLYTVIVCPFNVPFRNLTNAGIDVIIALSSVFALVVAAQSDASGVGAAVAALQVITSVGVTVGSVLELALGMTRNFLFVVLQIKVLSADEKKRFQKEYGNREEGADEDRELPLIKKSEEANDNNDDDEVDSDLDLPLPPPPIINQSDPIAISSDDDDDEVFYAYDKNYNDNTKSRKSVPVQTRKFELDVADANRRAEALSRDIAAKFSSLSTLSPRNDNNNNNNFQIGNDSFALSEGNSRSFVSSSSNFNRNNNSDNNHSIAAKNAFSTSTSPQTSPRHGANTIQNGTPSLSWSLYHEDDNNNSNNNIHRQRRQSTAANNMSTFRKQQEIALASVLYHICQQQQVQQHQQQQPQNKNFILQNQHVTRHLAAISEADL